jgi:outer membrane protein W
MKLRSLFVLSLLALGTSSAAAAQARGFHVGAALNGSSLEVSDDDIGEESESESGGGLSLTAGYNFTPRLGIALHVAGANISSEGGDYALGHGDLVGRFAFADVSRSFVPYLELGFSGVSATQNDTELGDVELSGGGITGAAGLNYFFNSKLALDVNVRVTSGEFDTVKVDGGSFTSDDGVSMTTARLNIGVSWFPRGGR